VLRSSPNLADMCVGVSYAQFHGNREINVGSTDRQAIKGLLTIYETRKFIVVIKESLPHVLIPSRTPNCCRSAVNLQPFKHKMNVRSYAALFDFQKIIAFSKVLRRGAFVLLVRATCKWKWVGSII